MKCSKSIPKTHLQEYKPTSRNNKVSNNQPNLPQSVLEKEEETEAVMINKCLLLPELVNVL